MVRDTISRFKDILNTAPDLLRAVGEEDFMKKTLPGKWSKKEILGHLIDSAANNHHRFVRGQFEHAPEITYDQNKWNEFSYYQDMESRQLIVFWTFYNEHLLELMLRIPDGKLMRPVKIGNEFQRLDDLIIDYVAHLEHHLRQIIHDY